MCCVGVAVGVGAGVGVGLIPYWLVVGVLIFIGWVVG